jgi:hypothetical protein
MRNAALATVLGLTLFGAAYAVLIRPPRQLVGETPEKGVDTEVSVGEVIYAKFDYVEYYGARIPAGYNGKFMLGQVSVPPSTLFVEHTAKQQQVQYCSREPLYVQGRTLTDIVCFKDTNQDGKFEEIRVPSLRFGGWAKLKVPPLPYEEGVDHEQTKGFRQELLYQGIDGNSLSLSYREFIDSLARPAFQQDVRYTLDADGETEIAFRGARFLVFSASNTSLRYRLVAGLPSRPGGAT